MYTELTIDLNVPQAEELLKLHNQYMEDSDFESVEDFYGQLLFNINEEFDEESLSQFSELDYYNISFGSHPYGDVISGLCHHFPKIEDLIKTEIEKHLENEENSCGMCSGTGISSTGKFDSNCFSCSGIGCK